MAETLTDRTWMSGGLAHPDIVTVGAPALRTPVPVCDDQVQGAREAERMVAVLRELKGAGLAAPQLGIRTRILVVEVRKTDLFPERPVSPLLVMLNPEIVDRSEDVEDDWEGCYSIPGLMGIVPRPQRITVRFETSHGERKEEHLAGYVARVVQHEFDHLDGHLFVDRMRSMNSLTTVANYLKYAKPGM